METSISESLFRSRSPGTPADQREILLSYAEASGRRFNNMLDALSWPDEEALMILRNRSAVINLPVENAYGP